MNFMVTTNQKPIIDTQKIKRKESKHTVKVISTRKEHRRTTETTRKKLINSLGTVA